MARKKTPDILGDILGNSQNVQVQVKEKTQEIITETPKINISENVVKIKSTFYFDRISLDALEEAWLLLRKMNLGKKKISKSMIIETAIQTLLEDIKTNQDKSIAVKKLL